MFALKYNIYICVYLQVDHIATTSREFNLSAESNINAISSEQMVSLNLSLTTLSQTMNDIQINITQQYMQDGGSKGSDHT